MCPPPRNRVPHSGSSIGESITDDVSVGQLPNPNPKTYARVLIRKRVLAEAALVGGQSMSLPAEDPLRGPMARAAPPSGASDGAPPPPVGAEAGFVRPVTASIWALVYPTTRAMRCKVEQGRVDGVCPKRAGRHLLQIPHLLGITAPFGRNPGEWATRQPRQLVCRAGRCTD